MKVTSNALAGVITAFYENDEVNYLFLVLHIKVDIKIPGISKIKNLKFFLFISKMLFWLKLKLLRKTEMMKMTTSKAGSHLYLISLFTKFA